MSTTDSINIYKGSCCCGGGEIIITFCTPDHPWRTESKWFEQSITCKACDEKYCLVEQNKKYILVDKSEVWKRIEYQKEYMARSKVLLSSTNADKLLNYLVELLEQQASIAAVYRLLQTAHLVSESVGTFRKKWNGAENWVRNRLTSSNLPQVMELVGVKDEIILQEIKENEKLWAKSNEPLPYLDKPVCDVSHYI